MGLYYECDATNVKPEVLSLIDSKWTCMDYGGDWLIMDTNFDNILEALIAMFKIALTEGWIEIMFHGIEVDVGGGGLTRHENTTIWMVFFMTFLFFGGFFLLNLFDGIVIDNFYSEKEKYLKIADFSSG